jgi:hypothetical protein
LEVINMTTDYKSSGPSDGPYNLFYDPNKGLVSKIVGIVGGTAFLLAMVAISLLLTAIGIFMYYLIATALTPVAIIGDVIGGTTMLLIASVPAFLGIQIAHGLGVFAAFRALGTKICDLAARIWNSCSPSTDSSQSLMPKTKNNQSLTVPPVPSTESPTLNIPPSEKDSLIATAPLTTDNKLQTAPVPTLT